MAQNEKCMKGQADCIAAEMKKMINHKDSSDIRFVIGAARKAVYAHRCILAARCDVFRAMFMDQSQKHKDGDVPFVMSDMTLDVFMPLLEYIYTNYVTLTSTNAIDVLGAAIEYGLEGLRKLCVDYLIATVDVHSACEAMQAGVTYGQAPLTNSTLNYIEEHTKEVLQTKGFHEMSDSALVVLLQSSSLDIDESDILAAVREWATVNSVVMSKSIQFVAKKVVNHIRLPLLSPDELKDVEAENKKDKMIPVELIAYAWKFHALKEVDKTTLLTTRRKGTRSR